MICQIYLIPLSSDKIVSGFRMKHCSDYIKYCEWHVDEWKRHVTEKRATRVGEKDSYSG